MKWTISYLPPQSAATPSTYIITCEDSEAKALMKAINHELKWMEANRRKELKAGSREAATQAPFDLIKQENNQFHFDNLNQVALAAKHLIGQLIKPSFLSRKIDITTETIDRFIQACETAKN